MTNSYKKILYYINRMLSNFFTFPKCQNWSTLKRKCTFDANKSFEVKPFLWLWYNNHDKFSILFIKGRFINMWNKKKLSVQHIFSKHTSVCVCGNVCSVMWCVPYKLQSFFKIKDMNYDFSQDNILACVMISYSCQVQTKYLFNCL